MSYAHFIYRSGHMCNAVSTYLKALDELCPLYKHRPGHMCNAISTY